LKETSLLILLLHAAVLAVNLILLKVFPGMRTAVLGVYFILMPVGFMFFMPPPPLLALGMVLGGMLWVFYWGNRRLQ